MELQEEMSPADAVLLMSSVPERISDLVFGLDETRLRYRHGPAFPTLGGLIFHLLDSGSKVDALLRHAHLDGLATADVRATIDPSPDPVADPPNATLQETIDDFARVRRRTVDLLHGWGKGEWERVIADPRGGTHAARRLPHGHQARTGARRADSQPDRVVARAWTWTAAKT